MKIVEFFLCNVIAFPPAFEPHLAIPDSRGLDRYWGLCNAGVMRYGHFHRSSYCVPNNARPSLHKRHFQIYSHLKPADFPETSPRARLPSSYTKRAPLCTLTIVTKGQHVLIVPLHSILHVLFTYMNMSILNFDHVI